jgi:hypothetical protein
MKPRVRELPRRRWEVDFGDGRTAVIRQGWDMARGEWEPNYHWSASVPGKHFDQGERASAAEAFVSAWISVAVAPPGLYLEQAEVEQLADECERGDAGDTAKILRELLRQRTGLTWSCRVGRNRERFCVRICAPASRLVADAMTAADRVLLASIFGARTPRDGLLVEPHRGCRADAVWLASGVDRSEPETIGGAVIDIGREPS